MECVAINIDSIPPEARDQPVMPGSAIKGYENLKYVEYFRLSIEMREAGCGM